MAVSMSDCSEGVQGLERSRYGPRMSREGPEGGPIVGWVGSLRSELLCRSGLHAPGQWQVYVPHGLSPTQASLSIQQQSLSVARRSPLMARLGALRWNHP